MLTQPPKGSATSHIPLDYLIPQDKRITIACGPFLTLRPMFFSYASASLPPPPSRTSARSGFPRSTTTAPAFLALLLEHRQIYETILACERSWPSRRCNLCGKKTESGWRKSSVLSSTWSAVR